MKEKQVKKTFLPQDIAILAVVFAAGAACFPLGEGWGELGVIISQQQVSVLETFATDKK